MIVASCIVDDYFSQSSKHLLNSIPGNLPPSDIFFLEAVILSKEKITDSRCTSLTICASYVAIAPVMERNVWIQPTEGHKYV